VLGECVQVIEEALGSRFLLLLGLLGGAAQRLLDRRAGRWAMERPLGSVKKLLVDFDGGALDHAYILIRAIVHTPSATTRIVTNWSQRRRLNAVTAARAQVRFSAPSSRWPNDMEALGRHRRGLYPFRRCPVHHYERVRYEIVQEMQPRPRAARSGLDELACPAFGVSLSGEASPFRRVPSAVASAMR
jgi:hypothetical protein